MIPHFNKYILIFSFNIICLFLSQGCSDNANPKKSALVLVINSHAANRDIPVHRLVENFVKEKGDDVKPLGWRVEKLEGNRYLVSYKYTLHSFTEGIGERGFFFEVDLADKSVSDKTIEYIEKMPPLTKAYSNEKEIFKDITGQVNSTDILQE